MLNYLFFNYENYYLIVALDQLMDIELSFYCGRPRPVELLNFMTA